MGALEVELVTRPTDEVRALVEALETELAANYPAEQRHGLPLDRLFQPHIRFFVARSAGVASGCCGVALFERFGELKRMYVPAPARGAGVADALLRAVEAATRAAGLPTLRLETGPAQHAALRFYARCGFARCAAFAEYAEMAPAQVAGSVFMEKSVPA